MLPGIGKKSAYRIAFYLLRLDKSQFDQFLDNLHSIKSQLRFCIHCFGISDKEVCDICSSPQRDATVICVVEHAEDIYFIENTGEFRGKYHVLNGVISPVDGVGPEQLKIKELLYRVDEHTKEILIATNPTLEGDATALYLQEQFKEKEIKVSRIAHGVTIGSTLEYADQYTLGRAIKSRLIMS